MGKYDITKGLRMKNKNLDIMPDKYDILTFNKNIYRVILYVIFVLEIQSTPKLLLIAPLS